MSETMTKNQIKTNHRNRCSYLLIFVFLFSNLIEYSYCAPQSDKIASLPGYPPEFPAAVYSGYLKTSSDSRKLHYVFIQNYKGSNNTLPVTLWMNGGPGCASKLGLLQQIAPYVLPFESNYKAGDNLVFNKHSWLNLTNLLFIDGPAGVGYSVNKDPSYIFNDKNSAQDTLDAILDFFINKFPQYSPNNFYLSGESYAGKYIPDLAVAIQSYNLMNSDTKINLKGILIGNAAINFKSGSLEDSQIQYMMSHHFIDPKIYPNWQGPCHIDPQSAGCQFFYARYQQLLKRMDFYNIYGPCLDGKVHLSQSTIIKNIAKKHSRLSMVNNFPWTWTQFSDCSNDKPINDYFTINSKTFNSQVLNFQACNSTIYKKYDIYEGGSISQIQSLIGLKTLKIYLFSGDWDNVIPFTDTLKNIQRIGLQQDGMQIAMKNSDLQHIGFMRDYKNQPNFKFFIIKGAGHQAVGYKPQAGYKMLQMFLTP